MAGQRLIEKSTKGGHDGIGEHLIDAEEGQIEHFLDGTESKNRCSRRFWLIAAILIAVACAAVVAVGGIAFFVLRPPPPPPELLHPADNGQHGPRKMVSVMKEPLQEPETMPEVPFTETPAIAQPENETKPPKVEAASGQLDQGSNSAVLTASSNKSKEDDSSQQPMSEDALWGDEDLFDEDLFDNYDSYSTGDDEDDDEEDYDDDDEFYVRKVIASDYYGFNGDDEGDIAAKPSADLDFDDADPLAKLGGYDYIVDDESDTQKLVESAGNDQPKRAQAIDILDDEDIPPARSWGQDYIWPDEYSEEDVELSEIGDAVLDSAAADSHTKGKDIIVEEGKDEGTVDEGIASEKVQIQPEAEWNSPKSQRTYDDDDDDDDDDRYDIMEDYDYGSDTDVADDSGKLGEEIESFAW